MSEILPLPCPFCGAIPKAGDNYKQAFACQTVGCCMGGHSINIKMWNRRAPLVPDAAVRETAAQCAKELTADLSLDSREVIQQFLTRRFLAILNNPDKWPKEHDLADAAIAAKDELNATLGKHSQVREGK